MAGLQDLLQGAENAIGGAAQGVGNFVNQDIIHPVEQVFQPQPVQAPIPQNHPMFQAPPIQNFTDWLGNQAKNFVSGQNPYVGVNNPVQQLQNVGSAVSNYFNPTNVGSADNPTPNFWNTPVAQGLGKAQQFIESPTPTQLVPTIKPFQGNGIPQDIANGIANIPGGIVNTVVGQGVIDPALDIGQSIGRTIAGREPLQYNQAKSPLTRIGYQIAGQTNPDSVSDFGTQTNIPQVVGNVAGALMPIATAYTGGKAEAAINPEAEQVAAKVAQPVWKTIVNGVVSGSKYGTAFGALQGFASSRNITNPFQYALNVLQNTAIGTATGAVAGGTINPALEFIGGVKSAITKDDPSLTPEQVNNRTVTYLRDRAGRFAGVADVKDAFTPSGSLHPTVAGNIPINEGGKTVAWMDRVDGAIGVDKNARASMGLSIRDVSKYPLPEQPEVNPEASIKEQLQQPPLPPKMSSKAIQEGLETPVTGRDISVSPQAAIRYRIAKNAGVKMTMGNPEPLPWENGNEPTPLSDEWINQRALPTTPADAGLPPKEDQPVVKISNKEDPVKITNPNGTVRDARAEMDTAKTQIQARGRVVQQLVKDAIDKAGVPEEGGNATNTGANKLFRVAIEHPENEPDILTQVKNPVQFKQALDQFREFTGFNLKAAQDAGAKLKGLKGYYSHIWDLSDPEKAAEFQQLSKASAQNYKGWYNKPRVFKDIAEGESYGFRLKNKNVANDVADYTNAFAKEQGARVLSNRLVSDFPDKAVILNQGDPTPIDMKQSDIPGAKGLFTSQDIKDQLKDLEPHEKTGLGVKIISNINNIDKQVRLGGGLFHIQNTGLDYLASQVGLGRFPRLITAARTFLDPAFYANYMRGAINDGTIDKMAKANVSLDTEQDFSGKQTGVSKLSKNPLTALNDATFKRLENFFKTEAFRALDNKGLIDTSTPQGVKVAQQYGREINNMFGGQNRVVGDDIFKSSVGRFTSHFGLLAPDYQQGRFKHTFSALGIGNGGGFNPLNRTAGNNYAAYTLALRVAITAMAAEGLRRALTGKFNPNLISVVKNDLLDPNFPTPWQNTSTNGTKENEIAHMPASNLSDWYRAISDPQQFAISHLGAGLSDATAFISNKDYFGNTISQTNNPVEKLFKIGLNDAPIPVVQAGKVISGRVPIGNAIINELGDRVSLDPNDPMALFYAGQKQAMNNLLSKTPDPKMQNALTSGLTQLQSVGALNPNDPRRKQVEYTIYAAFPQLFQVQQQASLAQAGGDPSKADPLFTSPYANEYIEYEQVSSSAPGSSEEKDYLNQHPELIPLIQARAAFYQAHPIAQNPNAPAYIPAPQPNSYVQQQLAAKNYNDPQVQAYLTAHGQYVNNQRQAIGLPMLNSFGQNPMEAAKSNASYQRNQMYSLSRKLKYINKESAYQTKKFKEKNANVNRKYARIRSEKMPVYSARKVAYSPLQNSHYRIVAPPTVKKAGYKAAFKVPANIKYPTLTIG